MAMPPENHDCSLITTSRSRTGDSVCKVACGSVIADFSHAEITGRSNLPKVSSDFNVGRYTRHRALHIGIAAPCYFLHTDMETPPIPRSQSTPRNIYAFGLTSFLNDTASEMAYWVLPAFLASIGAGAAQLGIIEGVAESVASFAQLFSGYLADKVSHRKPIVVGGYFVANAVKPLLALVSSWWQILGIRFADRFAKGVRGTARDVMVADSVDNSNIGSAYGLIQAMDSAGAIVGPLLALAVIGRFGMRGVFAWAAIPGALCVIAAWIGIREQFVERRASSPVKLEPVERRASSPVKPELVEGRASS